MKFGLVSMDRHAHSKQKHSNGDGQRQEKACQVHSLGQLCFKS